MSSFKDITIFTTDNGLTSKYQHEYKANQKQRILESWRKIYFDTIFDECVIIFKSLVRSKDDKEFFNQVRNIKEKGIEFFEKLLGLDIPERFNQTIIDRFVMFKNHFYSAKVYFRKFHNLQFIIEDNDSSIMLKDVDDDDEYNYSFGMLVYNLNLKESLDDVEIHEIPKDEQDEEKMVKKQYSVRCDWRECKSEFNPEEFFLQ